MKITKSKLNQIIKEEVVKLLVEQDEYDYEEEELTLAEKIIKLLSSTDHWDFAQGVEVYLLVKDVIEASDPAGNNQILEKLKVIDQFKGSEIPDVGFLSGLRQLNVTETIDLNWCTSLENVDGLQGLTNLTYLELGACESLQNVDGLEGCTNLKRLDLRECSSLENVDGLKECTNLTHLNLYDCRSLQSIDGLKECTNLTSLNLSYCSSLQNIDGLKGCTNLTILTLNYCSSLPSKLQRWFTTDNRGTAYEQFMKALNASKRNRP